VIVAYTEADEIITSGLAIRAVRNMSIDTSVKADSVVNNTNESRSKLEQVAVKLLKMLYLHTSKLQTLLILVSIKRNPFTLDCECR
jgi:uncharacterized protein YfdQ (DUF2303 family)